MGKIGVSALTGAVLATVFVACGGSSGPPTAAYEADGGRPQASAFGERSRDAGEVSRDAPSVTDTDVDIEPDDAGEDAPTQAPIDAGVDSGSTTKDSGTSTPSMFALPGRLIKDQTSTCWSGPVIANDCDPVPTTNPPVFEVDDQCTADDWPTISVRVPSHTCAKFTSQFATGACVPKNSNIGADCAKATNATDQDHWVTVHYKRVVVRWEDESVCPYVSCD